MEENKDINQKAIDVSLALAVVSGLLTVIDKIMVLMTIKKQNAEMTPEQETEFDALEAQRRSMPHWQASDDINTPI